MNEDPNKNVPVLEHDADGIKELDNLLPRWWVWLFVITVVYSAIYLLYYHVLRIGQFYVACTTWNNTHGQWLAAIQQTLTIRPALRSILPAMLKAGDPTQDPALVPREKRCGRTRGSTLRHRDDKPCRRIHPEIGTPRASTRAQRIGE